MAIFYKYQGCGNDFVIFDNRENQITLSQKQIASICHRNFGVGADGLMLLQNKEGYDFEMIYYNSDGNPSSMCGNGGRCLTQFAKDMGIVQDKYKFIASDGEHDAFIAETGWVHLKMKNVEHVINNNGDYIINTGSPHYVKITTNVKQLDVFTNGKAIRNSEAHKKEGINVNFVEITDEDNIFVRTYERGVENETLSCGTGVTASALACYHNENGFNRVEVETLGGKLAVEFDKIDENSFTNIWLCGPATFVFKGEISI
ncbi:MAG: diaminopimelate epimerase [Chitinophagaceae bacterium]